MLYFAHIIPRHDPLFFCSLLVGVILIAASIPDYKKRESFIVFPFLILAWQVVVFSVAAELLDFMERTVHSPYWPRPKDVAWFFADLSSRLGWVLVISAILSVIPIYRMKVNINRKWLMFLAAIFLVEIAGCGWLLHFVIKSIA